MTTPDFSHLQTGRHVEILEWWRNTSETDAQRTIPKLIEYGSSDLKIMGAAMRELLDNGEQLDEATGIELAIGFYLLGKIARIFGAARDGKRASDDTLFDTTVYSMMLRRVREFGEWG